jgi:hypothetical protein
MSVIPPAQPVKRSCRDTRVPCVVVDLLDRLNVRGSGYGGFAECDRSTMLTYTE